MNTAIAEAKKPILMASVMKKDVEAGRAAKHALLGECPEDFTLAPLLLLMAPFSKLH